MAAASGLEYTVSGELSLALPVLAGAAAAGITVVHDEAPVKNAVGRSTVRLAKADGDAVEGVTASALLLARASSAGLAGNDELQEAQVSQWLAFASDSLRSDSFDDFAREHAVVRQLGRMGVRGGVAHDRAVEALANNVKAMELLGGLNAHLETRTFLVGEAVTIADYAVAAALGQFAFAITRADWPHVHAGRWFAHIGQLPEYCAIAPMDMTYGSRIGGQIDRRAKPVNVAAAAEISISKNKGAKKGPSQRDIEKAAKKTAKKQPAKEESKSAGPIPARPGAVATPEQPASNKTDADAAKDVKIAKTTQRLNDLEIPFVLHEHPAAKTVDDMMEHAASWEGVACKNLFLKAKKKAHPDDTQLWLLVAAHNTETAMKNVQAKLGYGKIVMRFAKEDLLVEHLGVKQGSVTPFCLMNDTALKVNFAIDKRIVDSEKANFHPLTNEATMTLASKDLLRFVEATGHNYTVVDFS